MIIVKVDLPEGYSSYCSDQALDDDYELDRARKDGIDAIVYFYGNGGYEGSGEALLRKDGGWAHEDLGHCSCYGPLDSIPTKFEPFYQMWSRMSDELQQQCRPLFDEVIKRGLDLV